MPAVAYLKGLLTAGEVASTARQAPDRQLTRILVDALQQRVDAGGLGPVGLGAALVGWEMGNEQQRVCAAWCQLLGWGRAKSSSWLARILMDALQQRANVGGLQVGLEAG